MRDSKLQRTNQRLLAYDLFLSAGLALTICSPYFLEKVSSNAYFAFNLLDAFIIPHIQSVVVLGLLIYLTILVGHHYGPMPRLLMIAISALFLIFVFRGFFSTAGIPPQSLIGKLQGWLSLLGQDWLDTIDPVTFRRVGVLALFGVGLAVLPMVIRDTAPLLRACATFGWVLGIITIFRAVPIMAADAEFSKNRQQAALNGTPYVAADKRVVWVIFDELDYSRLFTNRKQNLALPNLDRLQQESVSAENAVSPAWTTAISIPALTTGTYLTGTEAAGSGRLLLQRQNEADIEWAKASTIFSRLSNNAKKVSILGFYHPYCSFFPYVDPCSSQPVFSYQVWWWGIWQGLRGIPGIDLLARRYKWTNEGFDKTTRLQLEALNSHLSNKSTTLSFIHLDIPHLPGGRIHGVAMTKEMEALPGYEQNFLTVDWAVGEIVKNLEAQAQSQDILLIVSSDHWLRTKYNIASLSPDQIKWEFGDNSKEVHRIPFFVRRMRETSKSVIHQPISTIHTAHLIEDFLADRVTDHASIAAWWQDKPYVEPMIPKEYR